MIIRDFVHVFDNFLICQILLQIMVRTSTSCFICCQCLLHFHSLLILWLPPLLYTVLEKYNCLLTPADLKLHWYLQLSDGYNPLCNIQLIMLFLLYDIFLPVLYNANSELPFYNYLVQVIFYISTLFFNEVTLAFFTCLIFLLIHFYSGILHFSNMFNIYITQSLVF